jgi:DNA-binding beta-propeller fold protein YncE
MSATTGAVLASVTGVGGSDQAAYDPKLNRFYVAARDMTASGISQTGNATPTFTPVLGIINASTFAWIANVPTGKGSHSVAVDPSNGFVYVPVPPTSSSTGGIEVFEPKS